MAPTDCFDDAGATCASSMISGSVPEARLLPTTRSPLHHGTDPDLSAAVPLPSGVAAKGLDLSPVMGSAAAGSVTSMAKRKLRGSPARGGRGGGSPVSPMQARLSRGFPPSGVRPSGHPQAKRVAASGGGGGCASPGGNKNNRATPTSSPLSSPHSCCITGSEQPGPSSFSAGQAPPPPQQQEGGGAGAAAGMGMNIGTEQEDGPPALPSLGSVPGLPCSRPPPSSQEEKSGELKREQQLVQQEQEKKPVDINDMMLKAKKASDNIRLLLHAKRCEGGACQEPGCESARQLVGHMRGCHLTRGAGCTNPKCVQAQKMLRHYAECNRKRALGGRYCLVCSLVARSATSTNHHHHHHANSNVMAPSSSVGSPAGAGGGVAQHGHRQPLGYLGPGSVPRRGQSVQQHQGKATKGAAAAAGDGDGGAGGARLSSPVAISRLRRFNGGGAAAGGGHYCGGGGGGVPPQRMQLQQLHGAVHHQQRMGMMSMSKDGKFFRPLPRTRRGSWGGYDRTRYRRTRFDSIPEEVPEEDCEEDNYDEDTASDAGSKPTVGDGSSSSSGTGAGDRTKTLVSSISL